MEKRKRQEKEREIIECVKQYYLNASHTTKKENPYQLNKVTLVATNAQGADLINIAVPVTIANVGNCELDVRPSSAWDRGTIGAGMSAKKVYTINGRYLCRVGSPGDISALSLPKGVLIISGGYGALKRIVKDNAR